MQKFEGIVGESRKGTKSTTEAYRQDRLPYFLRLESLDCQVSQKNTGRNIREKGTIGHDIAQHQVRVFSQKISGNTAGPAANENKQERFQNRDFFVICSKLRENGQYTLILF